jgi:hypothetical protein
VIEAQSLLEPSDSLPKATTEVDLKRAKSILVLDPTDLTQEEDESRDLFTQTISTLISDSVPNASTRYQLPRFWIFRNKSLSYRKDQLVSIASAVLPMEIASSKDVSFPVKDVESNLMHLPELLPRIHRQAPNGTIKHAPTLELKVGDIVDVTFTVAAWRGGVNTAKESVGADLHATDICLIQRPQTTPKKSSPTFKRTTDYAALSISTDNISSPSKKTKIA